jgi:hypothetical protein
MSTLGEIDAYRCSAVSRIERELENLTGPGGKWKLEKGNSGTSGPSRLPMYNGGESEARLNFHHGRVRQ